jgi:hypothetical protein
VINRLFPVFEIVCKYKVMPKYLYGFSSFLDRGDPSLYYGNSSINKDWMHK